MKNRRKFIHIQGPQRWCETVSQQLLDALPDKVDLVICAGVSSLVPAHRRIKHIDITKKHTEIENLLGNEFAVLIFNAYHGFNPNLFCALAGLVRSPGLIILLSPKSTRWPDYPDPDYQKICSHPYTQADIPGRFIIYFNHMLGKLNDDLVIIDDGNKNIIETIISKCYWIFNENPSSDARITPSSAQAQAVSSMVDLICNAESRIILIYGNRGRGKSTTIGIALKRTRETNPRLNACIVSANRGNIKPIFDVLGDTANNDPNVCIKYLPPDIYLESKPDTDILVIDEAASLPLNILTKLVNSHSKVVISTTVDGYEGSGMGFLIKFTRQLRQLKTPLTLIELKAPFRWLRHDVIENFLFTTFLPNNLDNTSAEDERVELAQLRLRKIDRQALCDRVTAIQQIFSLLAKAHYRTTPDDLRYLLDAPDIEIWTAEANNQIIAAMVVANEGVIDDRYSEPIWLGKRRLSGHLIPQTLSFQCGFRQAINYAYKRVIRIATAKPYRQKGVSSHLLRQFYHESVRAHPRLDFVGVSFGFEVPLVKFWQKLNFHTVRLSHRKNARSGLMSVLMLKPVSAKAEKLTHALRNQYAHDLSFRAKTLSPDMLAQLTPADAEPAAINWERIRLDVFSFAFGHRPFPSCRNILVLFATYCINSTSIHSSLSCAQTTLLNHKVMDDKSWRETATRLNLNGKKEIVLKLREIYAIFYNAVWGNKS